MMNLLAGCFIAALIILLPAQEGAAAKRKAESSVERGLYLVTATGCNDCHSPKTMTPTGPLPDKGAFFPDTRQAINCLLFLQQSSVLINGAHWQADILRGGLECGEPAILPTLHLIRKPVREQD